MQIFSCPRCAAPVYFQNTTCSCGAPVLFDPDRQAMVAEGTVCNNSGRIGCNWIAESAGLCRSCAITEVVPDLSAPENLPLWSRTELAKRWLLASLGRWGWFTPSDKGARPVFRLLSEHTSAGAASVVMGHADGVITINVVEANEVIRRRRQEELGETYRTMLGHLRHETAHFLFLRISDREGFLPAFRKLFGDESADYSAALADHYADPGEADASHITSYATAHPHEDWAETIAHLLHLVDLLDSAAAAGLALPGGPGPGYDAYAEGDADRLVTLSSEVALAVNHVNRSLDLPDLYPFVLSQSVRDKIAFAHGHLKGTGATGAPSAAAGQ